MLLPPPRNGNAKVISPLSRVTCPPLGNRCMMTACHDGHSASLSIGGTWRSEVRRRAAFTARGPADSGIRCTLYRTAWQSLISCDTMTAR